MYPLQNVSKYLQAMCCTSCYTIKHTQCAFMQPLSLSLSLSLCREMYKGSTILSLLCHPHTLLLEPTFTHTLSPSLSFSLSLSLSSFPLVHLTNVSPIHLFVFILHLEGANLVGTSNGGGHRTAAMFIKNKSKIVDSVTRLGDSLDFGQVF